MCVFVMVICYIVPPLFGNKTVFMSESAVKKKQ